MEMETPKKMANLRPTRMLSRTPVPTLNVYSTETDSRLYKLLFPKPCTFSQAPKFVPLMHPELYYRDLEARGLDSSRMRRLHEENPREPEAEVVQKQKLPIPEFADFVRTELEVKKNKVRVRLHTKMAELYEKYKKGKKPDLAERVVACKDFGYPDEILKSMIVKHEKRLERKKELEDFLFNIFGEVSDKKPAKEKKKTIYQILKIKRFAFVKPDEPEEEPNEDSEVPGDEEEF